MSYAISGYSKLFQTNRLFHHPSLGTNLSLSLRDIIWVDEEKVRTNRMISQYRVYV